MPVEPDFRLLFESAPGLYLVLTSDLQIVAVSDTYLRATMTRREDILHRNIFAVFPDNPDDPAATGVRNLRDSLERVVKSGQADTMAVQRYDIRRPDSEGEAFEERFWSPVNCPVHGPGGGVAYIIHRVEDVTDFVRLKQEGRERERVTEGLLARADQMESEIYLRSQQLGDANRQLRSANEDLERLYNQIAALMPQTGNRLSAAPKTLGEDAYQPAAHTDMLVRIGDLIAEYQRLEDQLRQSQKMEAMGRLAGGVAHDFNNILTVITGFADMVLSKLPEGEVAEHVREIDRAAMRAASLTHQLLTFSRKQILQPRVLDLNEVVRGMEGLLRRLIGDNISFVTALSGAICRIKADRGQLEQVIMNLAVNARDAMPNGGRLVLETRTVSAPPEPPFVHTEDSVPSGPWAMMSVSDTGHGMDAETVSHIFEPFFTTKEMGKGTGLGLSTVYGVIEQCGGKLAVESSPGQGSVFRVWIPMEATEAVRESVALPSGRRISTTETILVVEDELPLRKLVCKVLADARYRVLEAANGQEAIILAAKSLKQVDLLITDVLMPGISGPDLMDKLRAVRPDLQVLFMSGYDRELLSQREQKETFHFLAKPFSPQTLLGAVAGMLHAGEGGASGGRYIESA